MQNEADLVADGGTAGGSIGSELRLVQLDEVLGVPARTIEGVVNPFRRAASMRATARRSRLQDVALWRVSA